ncbi:SDR family NAD(P)-dependent oxidoreductase [Cyclobacterium plantarum]|uniref:SDR family NAD(P)-dependent oxidoreductase n=1 Tax=Cyclobacterium plantarum TaxID=2716263 RepID=A0ABX0HER6_9BACT|nr:SDR family NAD(P)-dependent oxidoreductase [Cyclobacterium plantarum]NHE58834.1 SDR family NAD(P)-dependent oxidoreductase [Cyclobacterium plantarum]
MKMNTYTLITGASMGIGRAFAFDCAKRGMNLLLVALPGPLLEETRQQLLHLYPVKVLIYATDLTIAHSIIELYEFCKENRLEINMLINNAGVGAGGRFENIPLEKYLKIIDLNNRVLVLMCHYFLPILKKHQHAYMLNMSSMEATLPLPYKAVYTGTKNFVYAFSLALREEQRKGPVKITVVCPGPVMTNAEALKRMEAHGNRAKWLLSSPEEVAELGLNGLLKGKAVVIPGKINWILVKLMKVCPTGLKMRLLERLFRVYSKH